MDKEDDSTKEFNYSYESYDSTPMVQYYESIEFNRLSNTQFMVSTLETVIVKDGLCINAQCNVKF